MHPFGCIPVRAKWTVEPISKFPLGEKPWMVDGNQIVQRISDEFAASTAVGIPPTEPATSSAEPLDIDKLWPTGPVNSNLDMDSSLPPNFLQQKYDEALFGQQPLFFFPKQTLAKARNGMDTETYCKTLEALLQSPIDLDRRYDPAGDSEFAAKVKRVSNELVPLTQSLNSLRVRETQLQVIVAMELHGIRGTEDHILGIHFDRLCIWQAVGTHPELVNEFCTTVLVPFFKTRAPRKTKELVRISKGTVRTRRRVPKNTGPKREIKVPGLLRALQMQRPEPSESPPPSSHANSHVSSQASAESHPPIASRSISHPVYRQQSRSGTVEVRFKQPKRVVSVYTPPPQPSLPPTPASPPSPPRTIVPQVQPTPQKDRQRYLTHIPSDSEEIGSTDSD